MKEVSIMQRDGQVQRYWREWKLVVERDETSKERDCKDYSILLLFIIKVTKRLSDHPLVRSDLSTTVADRLVRVAVGRRSGLVRARSVGLTLVEGGSGVDSWVVTRETVTVGEARAVVSWVVPLGRIEERQGEVSQPYSMRLSARALESTRLSTHDVVNVRTPFSSVGFRWEATSEGELGSRHKGRPFLELSPLANGTRSSSSEDQPTWGVAGSGSSVRVELVVMGMWMEWSV